MTAATSDNGSDALDKILEQIGDFGRLQVTAFFLICISLILHSATHIAYVFTAYDSDYRCIIPECDGANPSYRTKWAKNVLPFTSFNKPEKCEMYVLVNESSLYNNCSADAFDRADTVRCNSYVFRDDENYIGRDFNLLCDENLWKLALIGTINTVGMFFGLVITGIISDRYGRKSVLLIGMAACGVTGVVKAFSPSYEWFCALEFLEAVFAASTYSCAFILGVELVTAKKRVLTGCLSCSSYALGEVLVAIIAWSVRDWKLILYITYGPCILLIFLWWSIPESIRWYLSKGRIEEPKKILRKFAEANGKEISEESLDKLKQMIQDQDDVQETVSFMEMCKSMTLFWRLVNCCFLWAACTFLFYGLTLNSVSLSSNSYVNFIYISLTEIPAYWTASYTADRLGRKYSMSGFLILASISCFSFVFIGEVSEWIHITLYCIGKYGTTSAFILVYMVVTEVFPTSLRTTTMGVCSMVGRVGSVASPQVPLLMQIWRHLPVFMFATLAAVAAFTSLFLPETLNVRLPDTIKEAERIGKKSKNAVEDISRNYNTVL